MAIDKKEFEKELELSEKGAEVLKERLYLVQKNEKRIEELEKRIEYFEKKMFVLECFVYIHKRFFEVNEKVEKRVSDLEKRITEQQIVLKIHTEYFKEIADSLESNLSIVNQNDERFRRHVNNVDVHVSVQ